MPLSEPSWVSAAARPLDYRSVGPEILRSIAVEKPVNVQFGPLPFAVMMATPQDLEDFAYGFSFTEGIIRDRHDILDIALAEEPLGLRLTIALQAERMQAHMARKRALSGRTGCGLCGIEDLSALPRATRVAGFAHAIEPAAIARALKLFGANQPLNQATRAVHAAAFFTRTGALVALREDVGRHNALDKLIGSLLREGVEAQSGFVVISSRCSFEMVEKAALYGVRMLVAISAPTSLALERARAHDMSLVAIARDDSALIFHTAGTEAPTEMDLSA